MKSLNRPVRTILRKSLNLCPEDTMLVIAEESFSEIAELIWANARKTTRDCIIVKLTRPMMESGELPAPVRMGMDAVSACVILTSTCITMSELNRARKKGARFIILQRATKRLIERCLSTDYTDIANKSRRLVDLFSIGKSLHITSALGTDLLLPLTSLAGNAETGMACQAGELSYLPAGEACLSLNQQYINGRIVIDRIAGQKKLTKPILLLVNNSQITQIKGAQEADALRKLIRKFGKEGRKVRELGIGTNDQVTSGSTPQEDEKICGSLHISFGQDRLTKIQGRVHDAVRALVMKPTLKIDGKRIVSEGQILV